RSKMKRHHEFDDDETGKRDIGVPNERKADTEGEGDEEPDPGKPAVEARLRLAVAVAHPACDKIADNKPRRHRAAEPESGLGLVHPVHALKEGCAPEDEGKARHRDHAK